MSASISYPVLNELSMTWWRVVRKVSETPTAAIEVIGYRMARMAIAGPLPSARDRHEFSLMSRKKIEAVSESVQVMGTGLVNLGMELAMETSRQIWATSAATVALGSSGTTAQWLEHQAAFVKIATECPPHPLKMAYSAAHLVQDSLAPIHDRATANAKRLGAL